LLFEKWEMAGIVTPFPAGGAQYQVFDGRKIPRACGFAVDAAAIERRTEKFLIKIPFAA
jgi:hypothetical protein